MKDFFEDKRKKCFKSIIGAMRENDLLPLWNYYCCETNQHEDTVFYSEEIDELFGGKARPSEVLDRLSSDFRRSDSYIRDTIFGIESTNYIHEWIDTDDLVDYFCRNHCRYEYDIFFNPYMDEITEDFQYALTEAAEVRFGETYDEDTFTEWYEFNASGYDFDRIVREDWAELINEILNEYENNGMDGARGV